MQIQRGPSGTQTITIHELAPPTSPVLTITLKSRKKKKAVKWDDTVVDNEHLNKKSSKCRLLSFSLFPRHKFN